MPRPWVTDIKDGLQLESSGAASRHSETGAVLCTSCISQHAVRATSKCSGKQPQPIFQQPISEVIIHSFGRGLSQTLSAYRETYFKQELQEKKRKRKGKFSRRDDISGALGAMPPADMTRSHRHCMLSWKRKEPLKNKLLHVQYSRKHALWGKAKGGETARTTEMDGNTCVGPHPKDADSGHQKTFSKE